MAAVLAAALLAACGGGSASPAAEPQWSAGGERSWMQFGSVVGTAGDVNGDGFGDLLVVAANDPDGPYGWLFIYHGGQGGLAPVPSLKLRVLTGGNSAAAAGDVNGDGYDDVVVGAPRWDRGQFDEGRVLVFYGSAGGLDPARGWDYEPDAAYAQLGRAVAGAGDVNGDGYDDVIAGAPTYGDGQVREGGAFLFYGTPHGLSPRPGWTFTSGAAYAEAGAAVAGAGDVNGDGFGDVLVAAPEFGGGKGRVYLFYGGPEGLSPQPGWTVTGDEPDANLGWVVAGAGDVNGDGLADFLVSWPGGRPSGFGRGPGRVLVFHGSPQGPAAEPAWTGASTGRARYGVAFGVSAGAGDFNCDGYADVAVGETAPTYLYNPLVGSAFPRHAGEVLVFYGSRSGLARTPGWRTRADQPGAFFASSLGSAGDVDGDGCAEVAVGAPFYDDAEEDEGRAYVYGN